MFVLTKLITTPEGCDFYMLGGFATLKEAANAATEEYKEYNKKASFVNLEMVTALDLSLTGTIQMTLTGGVVTYVSRRYVKKIKQTLNLERRRMG